MAEHETVWTQEYQTATGEKPSRWRHREIREALKTETASKCAYCEAFTDDVSFPHVEHIIPKSIRPDLVVQWTNLTSACQRCNQSKGNYHDEQMPLLNPYTDQLERHLLFLGSMIAHAPGDDRAEITVMLLSLNRLDLANSRVQRITHLRRLFDRWYSASGSFKEILQEALVLDVIEGEFTQSACSYLLSIGFPDVFTNLPAPTG